MRISSLALLFSTGLLTLSGCSSSDEVGTPSTVSAVIDGAEDPDIGDILASVNGLDIGVKEFQRAAAGQTPKNGKSLSHEERMEVLNRLVDEKLLFLQAKDEGVDMNPKVQKVMVNTLLRDKVYSSVKNADFDQDTLQAYFEEHHAEFVVPEKIQIKRIFVKVTTVRENAEAKSIAEGLHAQLVQNPTMFKELAIKHSDDPYKRRGGDLGFISREGKPGIDPVIVEKAFTMPVGKISAVFEAGGGFNIITVENKREAISRTFEQMRGSVLRKVKNERYKGLYDEYVESIKGDRNISVNEDMVDAIKIVAVRPTGPGAPTRPTSSGALPGPSAGKSAPKGGVTPGKMKTHPKGGKTR